MIGSVETFRERTARFDVCKLISRFLLESAADLCLRESGLFKGGRHEETYWLLVLYLCPLSFAYTTYQKEAANI